MPSVYVDIGRDKGFPEFQGRAGADTLEEAGSAGVRPGRRSKLGGQIGGDSGRLSIKFRRGSTIW
jgi:hypothetical protein